MTFPIVDDTHDLIKLSYFADMGKDIAAASTIHDVLNKVFEKIGEIFLPLNWSLLLKDRKTGELYFKIVVGESAEKLQNVRIPKNTGIASWILEKGQPLIIENVSNDPRFYKQIDEISGFITKSIIGVPLKTNGKVFGVIELVNKLKNENFTVLDLKMLTTIADFAAIAIAKIYYQNALKRRAAFDYLTGVYNRRGFETAFEKELERAKRKGTNLALLLIDVDDFKKINDRYGHPAGDEILKRVGDILRYAARSADTVARFGGDEFALILPDTQLSQAKLVRKRILDHVKKHNLRKDGIPFKISIGFNVAGPSSIPYEDLLKNTDFKLYEEKKQKDDETTLDLAGALEKEDDER